MRSLAAFYFSGTGNTRYCVLRLLERLSKEYKAEVFDISEKRDFSKSLSSADLILIAFPIYGSAPPYPMREFFKKYEKLFSGKDVVILETQYFFSGDGAASLGRAIEKAGGRVIAAEHINMPNNLADSEVFQIKNGEALKQTLEKANRRIDKFAKDILGGKGRRRGFSPLSHAVGYFCQRKYFRKGEAEKRKKLSIDKTRCVGCGLCAKHCPVQNLKKEGDEIVPAGKCALCYRCVNLCPKKAITIVGKAPPKDQYRGLR